MMIAINLVMEQTLVHFPSSQRRIKLRIVVDCELFYYFSVKRVSLTRSEHVITAVVWRNLK